MYSRLIESRVRLNALRSVLISWRVAAAVWALARSTQANILTRSGMEGGIPPPPIQVDTFAWFKRQFAFFHKIHVYHKPRETCCNLITLSFEFYIEIIILAAHYFLIVRDAQESLVWKLCAVFTMDSEGDGQSDVVYKYCVSYLDQSGQSYYKAGIWAHVAAILPFFLRSSAVRDWVWHTVEMIGGVSSVHSVIQPQTTDYMCYYVPILTCVLYVYHAALRNST